MLKDLFRDASLYRRLRRASSDSIFGWSILFLGRRRAIESLVEVDGSIIYLHRDAAGGNSRLASVVGMIARTGIKRKRKLYRIVEAHPLRCEDWVVGHP